VKSTSKNGLLRDISCVLAFVNIADSQQGRDDDRRRKCSKRLTKRNGVDLGQEDLSYNQVDRIWFPQVRTIKKE